MFGWRLHRYAPRRQHLSDGSCRKGGRNGNAPAVHRCRPRHQRATQLPGPARPPGPAHPLTGLANRALLIERIEHAIAGFARTQGRVGRLRVSQRRGGAGRFRGRRPRRAAGRRRSHVRGEGRRALPLRDLRRVDAHAGGGPASPRSLFAPRFGARGVRAALPARGRLDLRGCRRRRGAAALATSRTRAACPRPLSGPRGRGRPHARDRLLGAAPCLRRHRPAQRTAGPVLDGVGQRVFADVLRPAPARRRRAPRWRRRTCRAPNSVWRSPRGC